MNLKLSFLLARQYPDLLVFDTICGATKERQSDLLICKGWSRSDSCNWR